MEIKTLKGLDKEEIKGKKFLVRLDLNVPIDLNGIIKDFTRIDAAKKTIRYIIDNQGKAIVISHLGRPKGKKIKNLTLRPVADGMSSRYNKQIDFVDDCLGKKVDMALDRMKDGQVLLLENLRFYRQEEDYAKDPENNKLFPEELSKKYDYIVNDAFGVLHRSHASVTGIIEHSNIPHLVGFLVQKELEVLLPLLNPGEKSIAIIGGGKVKDKIKAVESLATKYSKIIIGGVLSNVFMATKYNVGSSMIRESKGSDDFRPKAKELLEKHNNIILPKKVIVSTIDFSKKNVLNIEEGVPEGFAIFDDVIEKNLLDEISHARVVLWCGPIGLFEKGYKEGNLAIAQALKNNKKGITVIGGGETAQAAGKVNVTHVSTGGGATLELLTKGTLPGLEALKK